MTNIPMLRMCHNCRHDAGMCILAPEEETACLVSQDRVHWSSVRIGPIGVPSGWEWMASWAFGLRHMIPLNELSTVISWDGYADILIRHRNSHKSDWRVEE